MLALTAAATLTAAAATLAAAAATLAAAAAVLALYPPPPSPSIRGRPRPLSAAALALATTTVHRPITLTRARSACACSSRAHGGRCFLSALGGPRRVHGLIFTPAAKPIALDSASEAHAVRMKGYIAFVTREHEPLLIATAAQGARARVGHVGGAPHRGQIRLPA